MAVVLPDKTHIKMRFKLKMGKKLNLENPQTFNEKLQWLKLYDRKPIYTTMVDKVAVRDYITKTIGEEYLIPCLGVWDSPDDIDFDLLPEQFVLKCNHNSGLGMCICKDKSKLNIEKIKKGLKKGLAQNYYLYGREWPYKNVKPRIIAEQYMEDSSGGLIDYKFFCFNGTVDCVMVCIDRHINDPKFYFFDSNWKLKRLNIRGKEAPENFTLPMPECMPRMFALAKELAKSHSFVRVDLYECNGKIYFGELTFFPDSGFDNKLLWETDKYFGDALILPIKEKKI
ncbi:MAG: glycosyl transferase [Clostridia bacterium]|nr:glycosyl transferase [Clostridia bacterium]